MSALDGLEATLRRWGITTIVDAVAGRPGDFTPSHVMLHHTASPAPKPAPSARVVRDGRPGIPGPLCHVLVRRDLKVELVSRGKANHAGLGGPWGAIPQDTANRFAVGVEIEHEGTSDEPWRPEYLVFCRTVAAAICDHLNIPATRVLAHKEWAPTRKIDPYAWQMGAERKRIGIILGAGPEGVTPAQEDDDMELGDTVTGLGPGNKELLNQPDGTVDVGQLLVTSAAQAVLTNRKLADLVEAQRRTNALLAELVKPPDTP